MASHDQIRRARRFGKHQAPTQSLKTSANYSTETQLPNVPSTQDSFGELSSHLLSPPPVFIPSSPELSQYSPSDKDHEDDCGVQGSPGFVLQELELGDLDVGSVSIFMSLYKK